MIFIDEMKNLRVYRKQFFLPYNDKDKKHGSAVYLLTPNYISSKQLMTSSLTINRRYYESYYFERNAAYYVNSGRVPQDEVLAEAVEEQINSSSHNDFDYEAFDEYMLLPEGSDPGSENNTYYPSVMAAVVAGKLNNGNYCVYVHPVDHPEDPTYIGKIAVQVIQHAYYNAVYKWIDWEYIEDEGEYLEEATRQDALYNKDKFESGDINLCFITGLSGSGKSTMARGIKDAEHYELDDLLIQYNFSDDNLKEYGDLIFSFFKGPGKKYREVTSEDDQTDQYEEDIVRDFIKYAKSYAASHKNKKFIIEGVELLWFIQPSELKDYAVFVKGTSASTSMTRSSWRDSGDASNKAERVAAFAKTRFNKDRIKAYKDRDKDVQKWINYYLSKSVNEAGEELSKVYFSKNITGDQVLELYRSLGYSLPGNIAVKLHSGEPGNQNYIQPGFWKPIIDEVDGTVVECNTAYNGERNTTEKHMKVIEDHGWNKFFKFDLMDAEGPDLELPVENGHVLTKNLVGKNLANYDSMLVLSHFKGHPMGGYGGALKNISIGIASTAGKKEIHRVPQDMMVGEYNDFKQEDFLAAMADAASSVVNFFNGNMVFVNVMKNLSVDCDCVADAHDPCMNDIGILISTDPVALDQACLDLIYRSNDPGKDELIKRIEEHQGYLTPQYAEELGIGSRRYEFVDVDNLIRTSEATDYLDNDYTYSIINRWNIVSRDGADNACVKVKGYDLPMRGRSSMLVIKEEEGYTYIFAALNRRGEIKAPGGGWDINETPRDAAIRELQEEAYLKVKDVKHCGCLIEYHSEMVPDWVRENVKEEEWWYGYYSEIFVGKYNGEFNGTVEDIDKDDIAYKGYWIPLDDFDSMHPEEYINAVHEYLNQEKAVAIQEAFITENSSILHELENILLEISKSDREKNDKLEPVFIVNTYTGTPFGKLIKNVTKSPYSHSLLSFDSSLKKMYTYDFLNKIKHDPDAEIEGDGFIIDSIERYKKMHISNMKVIAIMVSSKVKRAMQEVVEWYKSNIDKTKYGFSNLLDYLKGSSKLSSFKDLKLFCSEFVDSILKSVNIDISGKSSRNTAPSDLGKYADKNNFFTVFEGRTSDYDEEEIEKEIREFRDNIPYKKLNGLNKKIILATEDVNPSNTNAFDLSKKLKYLVRKLKMRNKRGIYKFNKNRRDADNALPTVDQIQSSISIPTPSTSGPSTSSSSTSSTGEAVSLEEMRRYINALEHESENTYYLDENFLVLLDEAEKKYDSPLRRMLWNDRMKSNKEALQLYNNVKDQIPFIRYTYVSLDRYQNRNIFYDLSYYNEIFFAHNNIYKLDKAVGLYADFLSRLLSPNRISSSYAKKTIFIPILDWVDDPRTRTWLYRDSINPISVIYRLMVTNINKVKALFKDMDIIFMAKDCYFKINFAKLNSEQEKSCASVFKNLIVKIERGQTLDPDEIDDTPKDEESNKVIVTNIVDKIEKSQKINMATKSTYITTVTMKPRAFTGEPVAKPITSKPIKPVDVIPPKSSIKKDIEEEKKSSEIILKNTTKDNNISKEGLEQKQIDIEAREKQKEDLINQINNIASQAINTDDAIEKMNNDQQIADLILRLASEEDAGLKINQARINRMAQLNNEFLSKEVKHTTVKEILNSENDEKKINEPLPSTTIETESPFADQWKDLRYINFDKTYDINEDIVKMLYALSEKQYPIAIRNIDIQDNSTSEDYIDTYKIDIEDFRGKRSTIKLDIPKFKNNKYLVLRGNKKTIQNQYFNMPILKTDQDTVQIISNYNKIFIRRFGNTKGKSISYADRLIKSLSKYSGSNIKVIYGDNSKLSDYYDMPIDYIDISSVIHSITVKSKDEVITFFFNQAEIRDKYKDEIDLTKGLPYYYSNKSGIGYYNSEDIKIEPISSKIINIISNLNNEFANLYELSTLAKRYVYSQASILNQKIPLVIVCAYSLGLFPVLQKANIKYELIEKITNEIRHNPNKDYLKFSDGYLVFDISYDASMLLNGLKEIDLTDYSIDQVNSKRIYTEMLDNYGGRIIADGLENFAECMIDPITAEVLKHYKMPSDYIGLLINANALLSDNSYIMHGDASSRRLRRNELIAVKVYKSLFNDAYSSYATGLRHNRNNTVFTIKQSAVIDKFMTDTISSDLSVANCLNDIETANSITTKGESGMNSARSYTLDKRIYDKSMLNLMGMSTGFAGTVGVTRQATINMNIDGKRGYVKSIDGDTSKMNTANSLTITEALNPLGCTHDDPVRVAMTFVQTAKHQVRTEKSDPLLVTNGSDEVLPYLTTDIFCKKSEKAGTVTEITDTYMVVKYSDGSNDYIDLSDRIEKNSDGGFFVGVKLDTDLKVGQKVKPNEILAYDKKSFSKGKSGNTKLLTYDVGRLAKVAIINSDDNFEDSAMITSKLAQDLSTDVILKEEKILDANTNIYNPLKVGDSVDQEDILYETQTSYEDEDVNILLKNLAGDSETISKLGRRPVKSPVTGKIVGVKVYRTCELSEMSESMKKFVTSIEAKSKAVTKKLDSLGIKDPTLTDSIKKLEPIGKLKNCPNCILIEYYIEYHDIMAVGDKLSYWSANKGVVHSIVPSELAPYTDFRPDEEISAFTGIASINKRQIASNLLIGSLNKLCIELGRSVRDILGIPYIRDEI